MLAAFTAAAGSVPALAETLDRVVASVGAIAVTQSDVEREHHLGRFLDGQPTPNGPDAAAFEATRDRLVHQRLLEQEAEAEGIAPADFTTQAKHALEEIRSGYAGQEEYQSAIHRLGMSEEEILARLVARERALWVIDQRLRPAAWVEQAEVEAYYRETFVPEFIARGDGEPPPLPEIETQIREVLVQKKINELLTTWLEELKLTRRVRIRSR